MLGCALAAALCIGAIAAPVATAGDANRVPPQIELTAVGPEGVVSPRSEALAYFATSDFSPDKAGYEYLPGSKVTFRCAVDGRPVRCPAEYIPTERGGVLLSSPQLNGRPRREKPLPSLFIGRVPIPENLPGGPHTVSVVATDEDGTEAAPPSVTVTMDRQPPSAPELTEMPPRRSRLHKPHFSFTSSDDLRLVTERNWPFRASLRRLSPSRDRWREGGAETYLQTLFPTCPTLLSCSSESQAVYMAFEDGYGYGFGEPEWLIPGTYLFRVRAYDAARNRSPVTEYRFRILAGGKS